MILIKKKTFPLHVCPATKGSADIISVILLLIGESVDEDKAGDLRIADWML